MIDRIQLLVPAAKKKAFKMICLKNDTTMTEYLLEKINEYIAAGEEEEK
jgi:hypothetical protein